MNKVNVINYIKLFLHVHCRVAVFQCFLIDITEVINIISISNKKLIIFKVWSSKEPRKSLLYAICPFCPFWSVRNIKSNQTMNVFRT